MRSYVTSDQHLEIGKLCRAESAGKLVGSGEDCLFSFLLQTPEFLRGRRDQSSLSGRRVAVLLLGRLDNSTGPPVEIVNGQGAGHSNLLQLRVEPLAQLQRVSVVIAQKGVGFGFQGQRAGPGVKPGDFAKKQTVHYLTRDLFRKKLRRCQTPQWSAG